jgi:GT2 family glycosyltransferase
MRVAFLIPCTDEAALLEHALPAALAEEPDDILVVDNACTDATQEVVARHGARSLRLTERVPFTQAMNAGLRRLDADAVAFLQPDLFVTPGYREAALRALTDETVGSVAPKLLRAAGPAPADRLEVIDAAGMSLDRRRKNGLVGHGSPGSAYSVAAEIFGADGAAAVYRRQTLRECAVDGEVFDENMPGWGCDADLAWRARLLGWRSRYEPAAVAFHIRTYSPSTRADVSPADRRTQFRNRYLMMAKNDTARDLLRDAHRIAPYEVLALGYAVLRERELLGGYRDAWRRLPGSRRRRAAVQRARRVERVPFGLEAPA